MDRLEIGTERKIKVSELAGEVCGEADALLSSRCFTLCFQGFASSVE